MDSKVTKLIIILFGGLTILGIYFLWFLNRKEGPITNIQTGQLNENCVPTFMDGGGPYYKPDSPFRSKIVPDDNKGEKLVVTGRLLRNDCNTPVPGAVIDIWQANESGNYEDEWYRGRITSDKEGNFVFESVIPKGYGEGTGKRPPHIHFKVFENGAEIITSQMFFPEISGTEGFDDAYIMKLETTTKSGTSVHSGYHDIILP